MPYKDMKSYAESQGKEPFDWNAFLNQKHISQKQWRQAANLSSNWVTCACGNQCATIPRKANSKGAPTDRLLHELGVKFMDSIEACSILCDKDEVSCRRHFYNAKIYLKRIEERSIQLLKEIEEQTIWIQNKSQVSPISNN